MIIYRVDDKGELRPMRQTPYENEDLLQVLLASYPQLLSGADEDQHRWILIAREMPLTDEDETSTFSLDHLFIDDQGVVTLVEVKRSSDTRIRREVVGQMLDYASRGVRFLEPSDIRERFEQQCEERDTDPDRVLHELWGEVRDADEFWASVGANLRAGRIRLVFVADRIPGTLRRIVEFLNEQFRWAEVLAIEVKQYLDETGQRTLVPEVIGQTALAEAVKASRPTAHRWTADSLLEAISDHGEEAGALARRFMQWGSSRGGRAVYGTGSVRGSLQYRWSKEGHEYWPLSLLTTGAVSIPFGTMAERPVFSDRALRADFAERLRSAGIPVAEDALERWPEISFLETARREAHVDGFFRALDWFLQQLAVSTPEPARTED